MSTQIVTGELPSVFPIFIHLPSTREFDESHTLVVIAICRIMPQAPLSIGDIGKGRCPIDPQAGIPYFYNDAVITLLGSIKLFKSLRQTGGDNSAVVIGLI